MSAQHPEIVIVRRRSAHEDEHHGGAWKIAFADFMTAMMAFFLVLWIISATDKNTKTLIARYFNPVKVEEPAKAQKGIHGAPEQDAVPAGRRFGRAERGKSTSEQGESPGRIGWPGERRRMRSSQGEQRRPPTPQSPEPPPGPGKAKSDHVGAGAVQRSARQPRQDRRRAAAGPRIDPSAALKGYGEVGPSADEALRDPFRPLGSDKAVNVVSIRHRRPPAAPPPATNRRPWRRRPAASAEPPPAPRPPARPRRHDRLRRSADAIRRAPDAAEARRAAASDLLADVKKRLARRGVRLRDHSSMSRRPRRES